MTQAIWNGQVIAESKHCEQVEGNTYFPPGSIRQDYFKSSDNHSVCPWKGIASYYHLEVAGQRNPDAAWYYPAPKPAAANIRGYVAFWRGVQVSD